MPEASTRRGNAARLLFESSVSRVRSGFSALLIVGALFTQAHAQKIVQVCDDPGAAARAPFANTQCAAFAPAAPADGEVVLTASSPTFNWSATSWAVEDALPSTALIWAADAGWVLKSQVAFPAAAQSPPPAPAPGTGTVIRVNAGGPAYTDSAGNVWSADTGFNSSYTINWGAIPISGTSDPRLYQTERYGPNLQYTFTVPNGTYQVNLHFAENWLDATFPNGGVGFRVFSVQANGATIVSNLDVFATVGHHAALIKTATVTVTNGQLVLSSPNAAGWFVDAIEVIGEGGGSAATPSTAPIIYSAAAFESPVRADPDDLLLIPGSGFAATNRVVYAAVTNTTTPLTPPNSVPSTSTSTLGLADIASAADVPNTLTAHLPAVLTTDQSYALWVVTADGQWSNGVLINDARPFWVTPNEVYATAATANLPRQIKIVGRNLQPAQGTTTQVKLIGSNATYTLNVSNDTTPVSALERYAAIANLPATLAVGSYSIQVSRDGVSWVPLFSAGAGQAQVLSVLANPASVPQFSVATPTFGDPNPGSPNYGGCKPNDGIDDTACIVRAINAAKAAGGGTVYFGPGTWDMANQGTGGPFTNLGVSGDDGVLVPNGINLLGSGSGTTIISKDPGWGYQAVFSLLGYNNISGFTFHDANDYRTCCTSFAGLGGMLSLGLKYNRALGNSYAPYVTNLAQVSHVVITQNVFDKPFVAIGGYDTGDLPTDHLYVTDNVIGAYWTGIFEQGDPSNLTDPYHLTDSVIAFNTFDPGSYMDARSTPAEGTIATNLGSSYRVDFSNNTADGTSTAYLYNAATDAKGWDSAHFWSMGDNLELMLVSNNTVTCAGDKDGDGAAFGYDGTDNLFGFSNLVQPVVSVTNNPSADTSAITVQGSLQTTQYNGSNQTGPVSTYYQGYWLQIVQGTGVGQARKILSLTTGSSGGTPTVTFIVSPAFDVPPQSNSLASVGREYWQVYTVGNYIDHRTPLCLKSNRTNQVGGGIIQYGQTADSVIEGNQQYDTSGIFLSSGFKLPDPGLNNSQIESVFLTSTQIRGNLIDGAYAQSDTNPLAEFGIELGYHATRDTMPPPVTDYGTVVAHNTVNRAGNTRGAIRAEPTWYTGPITSSGITPWKMSESTLIFGNSLNNIGSFAPSVGIGIGANTSPNPIEWYSVLYGNHCNGLLPNPLLVDHGTGTVLYCPAGANSNSCGCPAGP